MVYGLWGWFDMVLFIFIKKILVGELIDVFNYGYYCWDFIYIDDIVEGVICILDYVVVLNLEWLGVNLDLGIGKGFYCIYNIGSNNLVELLCFIEIIEDWVGRKVEKNFLFMQFGDVLVIYVNVDDLIFDVGYKLNIIVEEGIVNFVDWYWEFYGV